MKPITTVKFEEAFLSGKQYFWNCRTAEEIEAYHKTLSERTDDDYQILLSLAQNNRKLYSLVSTLVPTMDGWCSVEKACALAGLVMALKPSVIVEIGVWAGRSLLPMALAAKPFDSQVIAIDPYSPQESAKNEIGENQKWWSAQDHQAIKEKFLQFTRNFGVSDIVELIEKPSDAVMPPGRIDILHIDGSHTEQALRDATRYGPSIPVGGVVVLDDLMWVGGGVLRAIDHLEDTGFSECFRVSKDGECWSVMQKVK